MQPDDTGFEYPVLNSSCIDCGKCEEVCNKRLLFAKSEEKKHYYAAWSKDMANRLLCTSGGVFSEIAKYFIMHGGYVCGAEYDNEQNVVHVIENSTDGIEKIRQSKYSQSKINDIYTKILFLLKEGKKVLFGGTPCQVAGLKAFLNIEYHNLITVDLICMGVNSPKAYKSWLCDIEKSNKHKIKKVWFRYKEGGWSSSSSRTKIIFDDDSEKVFEYKDNLYMDGFLNSHLFLRKSCGNCNFKGQKRASDITLGDYWGVDAKLDDGHGVSVIIANTSTGQSIIENISSELKIFAQENDEFERHNVYYSTSVHINKANDSFLRSLSKLPFSTAIKKYTGKNIFMRVILFFCRKIKHLKASK